MKTNTYTLFVGLNDKVTKLQEISTLNAYKMAMNVVGDICGGGTISEAQGFYTHDSGEIVIEQSLRIELAMVNEEQVMEVIEQLKVVLNQESVLMQAQIVENKYV